jgi:hypothetical protein
LSNQTVVQKIVAPDGRIEITAQFANGSGFRFASTDAGFSIGYIKGSTPAKEEERHAALQDFCAPLRGETRIQHAQRVVAFLRGCDSTTALVEAIKGRNFKL